MYQLVLCNQGISLSDVDYLRSCQDTDLKLGLMGEQKGKVKGRREKMSEKERKSQNMKEALR